MFVVMHVLRLILLLLDCRIPGHSIGSISGAARCVGMVVTMPKKLATVGLIDTRS